MPDGELMVGRLQRDLPAAELEIRKADGKTELSFSASSETPVERWFGTEILSHDKGAIRLARVNAGAVPLLFNHDWSDPIGMIDTARSQDKRLEVTAHLFDTMRAQEIASMLEGGLRNVSIGYQIHTVEERKKEQIYTATDWEPMEISIVTVPADPTIGIGRTPHEQANPVRVMRAASPAGQPAEPQGASKMPEVATPAAGTAAEPNVPQLPADQIESQRIEAIRKFCKANSLQENVERSWIQRGCDWNTISDEYLKLKQKQGEAAPQSVAFLDMSGGEQQRYSLWRALEAVLSKDWSKAGLELEASRAIQAKFSRAARANSFFIPLDIQRRDLTVASGAGGGYLVETANMSFVEMLRNSSVSFRAGATRLTGLVGNVTVPKQTAAATGYWLASESTQITESQQTFAQMALTPKTVGAYTEISRLLQLQSSPSAEQIVMRDLAQVVALAVDLGSLNGSGAAGQPLGLIGTSGIGGVTGTTLAYAGIVEFQTDVATANALGGSLGYVTTPAIAGLMKQRVKFTSTASPLWEGRLEAGAMDGYPAYSSNQVPTADMIFGDWSQMVIAEWGVLELAVNEQANFQAGIIGLRAFYTVDVGIRIPAAFSLATSIT